MLTLKTPFDGTTHIVMSLANEDGGSRVKKLAMSQAKRESIRVERRDRADRVARAVSPQSPQQLAGFAGVPASARGIIQLQRLVGNQTVARLLASPSVAAELMKSGGKLTIRSASTTQAAEETISSRPVVAVQREGCCPACASGEPCASERPGAETVYETAAQSNVQRTLGDNHDLTSPRFAGEPILEACYDDQARLTKGATGPAVVKIQQALVDLGYNLGPPGVDGIYGTYTWNAVKQFKKNESLGWEHMGDVGPGTMRRLNDLFPAETIPPVKPPPAPPVKPAPPVTPPVRPPISPPQRLPPCPIDDDRWVSAPFVGPSGPTLEPPQPGVNCSLPQRNRPLRYTPSPKFDDDPPASYTMDDAQRRKKEQQDSSPPALGKHVGIDPTANPTVTDEERLFLWYILLRLSGQERWGTHTDLMRAIGRPRAGGMKPVGQVTVKIDWDGNARIDLIKRGPVATPSTFRTKEEAKNALKNDFEFADVRGPALPPATECVREWDLSDLNKVHAALKRLPETDRGVLKGVVLCREHVVRINGELHAGEFIQDQNSGVQYLKLADLAFEGDKYAFIGSKDQETAPASFMTILHEVAHAVAVKEFWDASFTERKAFEKHREIHEAAQAHVGPLKYAREDANRAFTEKHAKSNGVTFVIDYLNALNAVPEPLEKFKQNQDASRDGDLAKDVRVKIDFRDEKKETLETRRPGHPALEDFKNFRALQNSFFIALKERAAAKVEHQAAQAKTERLSVSKRGSDQRMSKAERNFVDFVKKCNIPRLTKYAEQEWNDADPYSEDTVGKKGGGEFFAEAYSLWLNDRTYLNAEAPQLLKWFDRGGYRLDPVEAGRISCEGP